MQNKSLIPTPLLPEAKTGKSIEIEEPKPPGRFRLLSMMFFMFGLLIRHVATLVWPRFGKSYGPVEKARHVRIFMEKMGGLWVKAGQVVALRRDVFSNEFCTELAKLQDRATGFPFRFARTTIETELGRSIDEVFSEFREEPLAAASIGQTYLARLRTPDVEVVVKVRRPTIEQSFKRDLRYLQIYMNFLTRIQFMPHLRWNEMFWELEHAILEELDYKQEAATLRRMRKNLRPHKVYVPKVFATYCTGQVLVMEKVSGVFMSEYTRVAAKDPDRVTEWLRENDIDPYEAGKRLLFSHYRQLFEDNLYHCDLHPGNILLMRKNRITLIDFGSVGSTDKSQLKRYFRFLMAFVAKDYRKMADVWFLLSPALPNRDLEPAKERIVRLYRDFEQVMRIKAAPYHEKSISTAASALVQITGDAGVAAAWDFLRQLRAQLTVDSSLMLLMPEISYQKVIRQFIRKFRERAAKKVRSPKMVRGQMAKFAENVDLPTKLAENAYFEGEYLRRRALKYEGYISKASQIVHGIFVGISRGFLLGGVGLILVGLHQRYHILHRLQGTALGTWMKRIPNLEMSIWIMAALAAVYVSREFVAIRQVLEQPEAVKTGGDRR